MTVFTIIFIVCEFIVSIIELFRGNIDRAIYFLLIGFFLMRFHEFMREL